MQAQPLETGLSMTRRTNPQRGAGAATDRGRRLQLLETSVDRLEADKKLVLELALKGYSGPPWKLFANALAEYGFAVVRAWVADGKIFTECAKKGWPVRRAIARVPGDEIVELALETVGKAVHQFREKVLIPGRWDPSRGATLRTFFVGQCILQFPEVYRSWEREQCMPPMSVLPGDLLSGSRPVPPEAQVDLSRWLARSTTETPEFIPAAVAFGYSHAEIAKTLDTTVSGVEARLYRLKKRAVV